MRTQIIHFTNKNTNKILFMNQHLGSSNNCETRNAMKKILSKAIMTELTDKQRVCIVEHYINDRKEKDIALELGVNISTVSRHIKAGRNKLRNIAQYYM